MLSIGRQDSQIWEYLTEYIKDRYQVFLTKEVLSKIHMNGVVLSLSDKIGLRINQLREIDFAKFLPFDLANIEGVEPKAKDYTPVAFSLKVCQDLARDLDQQGKARLWYLPGTQKREDATALLRTCVQVSEQIYGF